ncbi:hypothetical protein GCM10010399_03960 [Dactylosporangium fulvum]|uniref:ATP-grasp domain-containing protein n=1 Tax=Dactylosporangium fulvum TaxID=53359 RepID=A0ABY5VQ95_9ACTN|nr:ATP-grasp domain-containing protein [Dactylosporangium fulvum]UWP79942.1 ATP-grasp domain-containing protein [Dactylosporangium fulvum]
MIGFSEARVRALSRSAAELDLELVVFDDPDVCRKKRVPERAGRCPAVKGVVAARYVDSGDFLAAIRDEHDRAAFAAVYPGLEYTVVVAAQAAQRLSLRGAGVPAARVLRDKLLLRERAQANGLANPRWAEVRCAADVAAFLRESGRVVLKPANRQASLGVQILGPGDDVDAAWAETVAADEDTLVPDDRPEWRFMVEELVVGDEYSVELLLDRGRPVFANVTAKSVQSGRYPVELGHVVPATLPGPGATSLVDATRTLVRAVGYDTGVVHAEWILTARGPVLVECAGRLPGDSIVELIDHAYGIDLSRALLHLLCAQPVPLPRHPSRGAAIRFLTAAPGIVEDIRGAEIAHGRQGVVDCSITVAVGDRVTEVRNSWERIGHVMAVDTTAPAAEACAAAAAASVKVLTR